MYKDYDKIVVSLKALEIKKLCGNVWAVIETILCQEINMIVTR